MVFPIDDVSRVGEARRFAAKLCGEMGFDETQAGQVAIVVNELGSNLVKHAMRGRLLIAKRNVAEPELEILSIDNGPGIRSLENAMRDGFSTAGSPGTGLGAVKRLAADFDIHSQEHAGTVIMARLRPVTSSGAERASAKFSFGAIAVAAPGETICGDGWALAMDGERAAVVLADGLGHGPEAHEAAQAAIGLFVERPFEQLKGALEHAHGALRMTRGAALTRATLDRGTSTIHSVGAGNVAMRVVSGIANRSVLPQNGTVGVQIRRVEETSTDWPEYAAVVLHSDGLQSRWAPELITPVLARDPSLVAALLFRDHMRGLDDVTVVVLRRKD